MPKNQDALFPYVEVHPSLEDDCFWIAVYRRTEHQLLLTASAGPVRKDLVDARIAQYLQGATEARRIDHRRPACHSPWIPHDECDDLPAECSQPSMELRGYVYFFQAEIGGPIKIGRSFDPDVRLRDLQLMSPFRLRQLALIPGSIDKEAELHRRFSHSRLHGEWFAESDELIELIREIQDG
jgi:hypothetical protein